MPRPTDETLTTAPSNGGFGTAADAASQLGSIDVSPIHSLDVDGATENAQMLAAVFNKVGDLAQHALTGAQNNAERQGAADATTGNVDPAAHANFLTASNYADGVHRTQVQTAAINAAGQAKAFFAANPNMPLTDTTDADGNSVAGLTTHIDSIFRAAFPNGADQDPTTANLVTPIMQHTLNEITGAAYQHQIIQSQQNAEDSQQALLVHDAQNSGPGLFNVPLALDTLTKVYGGDQRMGREALVKVVGEGAVQAGDPSLIQKYLPNGFDLGNGATLTPANLAYLDGARNRATVTLNKNNETQLRSAGMSVIQAVKDGRDPSAALQSYMASPNASPEFARSLLDWTRSQGADSAARALDTTDAAQLQSDIALGKVTTLEQAQQEVAAKGYTAGAAVQLVTHAASWLDAKHTTDEHDPQFVAARDGLDQLYRPGLDPLTGQFSKPADVQTHANVLSSFITEYQNRLNTGNVSAADAARQASDAVQKKYGPPTALAPAGASRLPTNDYEAAAYIRNSANRTPSALAAAGITGTRIKAMRDANLLSADEANAAASALLTGRH